MHDVPQRPVKEHFLAPKRWWFICMITGNNENGQGGGTKRRKEPALVSIINGLFWLSRCFSFLQVLRYLREEFDKGIWRMTQWNSPAGVYRELLPGWANRMTSQKCTILSFFKKKVKKNGAVTVPTERLYSWQDINKGRFIPKVEKTPPRNSFATRRGEEIWS